MFATDPGSASKARLSETLSQDRDLREAGLEALASRARGSRSRVITNPKPILERLRTEISSYYLLGVEPTGRDRDGRRHQIRVQVGRQNVQVRARQQVQYVKMTPNNWSRDVVMTRVLRSPSANTELPMRLSTYTFRDQTPNKVKLIFAAEIDPASVEMRPSRKGNYLALTCTIRAVSQDQLDALYRELTAHPLVKVVL